MSVRRIVPNAQASTLEESTAFYERLGLRTVMDMGWIVTLASSEDPKIQTSLLTEDATGPVVPDLSIEVDSLETLATVHAAVRTSGAEILHPLQDEEWGVRRFFARAPEGRVVNVLAHLPEEAG